MKNFFSTIIMLLIASISLTACSKEQTEKALQKLAKKSAERAIEKLPKHNEPIPEQPQITPPSELSLAEIDKNVQAVTTQIIERSDKLIYFSKIEQENGDRELVENKEDSEYYRTILGNTTDGNCIIQDFYSENDKKQIEPMIVLQSQCESWLAQTFEGMAIWYEKDGAIYKQNGVSWFNQGKPTQLLREEKDGVVIQVSEIRPDVFQKTYIIPKNNQTVICEYNAKTNQIEQLIDFQNNSNTVLKWTKNNFKDNKLVANQKILAWFNGQGFWDTPSTNHKKLEEAQNAMQEICGVAKNKPMENKPENQKISIPKE